METGVRRVTGVVEVQLNKHDSGSEKKEQLPQWRHSAVSPILSRVIPPGGIWEDEPQQNLVLRWFHYMRREEQMSLELTSSIKQVWASSWYTP